MKQSIDCIKAHNCTFALTLKMQLGRSTGFIATPLVLGHSLRFTLYLWKARPAFRMGLSVRPPPAIKPIIARHWLLMVFMEPEGRRILQMPSLSWDTMMAQSPEARHILPQSPTFSSMLQITVPSGIWLT